MPDPDPVSTLTDTALITAAENAAFALVFRHPLKRNRKALLLRELARRFGVAIKGKEKT